MSLYDSQDLVRRLKVRLNRPATDEAFTVSTADDVYYDALTEGQDRLTKLLGTYVPDAVWTVPTAITSSDGGETFGFGTDTDGAAIFAFGHFVVYDAEENIPDWPLSVGVDFSVEGTVLRVPNNGTRTGSLYVQYAAPSNIISSATQPTVPKFARAALLTEAESRCWKHLKLWGEARQAEADFLRDWADVVAAIQTRASGRGGLPLSQRPNMRYLR